MIYILTVSFWLPSRARSEAGDPFGGRCNNQGGSEYGSEREGEWQDPEHILKRKQTSFCDGCNVGRERKESKKMPGLAWVGHVQDSIACLTWGDWGEDRWRRPCWVKSIKSSLRVFYEARKSSQTQGR